LYFFMFLRWSAKSELKEIIDLKDADSTSSSERRLLRTADEDMQFSEDHYW